MRPIATDGVAWSACLSVCLRKRLNRSRCRLEFGGDFGGPREPCIKLGFRSPKAKGQFWGLSGPFKRIESRCLSHLARIRGRILTICRSYDVFSHKEVPFCSHIGGHGVFPKKRFESVNRHFQAYNAQNIKTCILAELLHQFQTNFAV